MQLDCSLESFRANIKNIVRPNKFKVEVIPPSSLGFGSYVEPLIYYAQSASIPDRNFNEIQIKYYGMEYKLPASEITQDLVINFIVDSEWNNRNLFEQWANMINKRVSADFSNMNPIKGNADELFKDSSVSVTQLGFKNNIIAQYFFNYVFPKQVDQIELHQETMDTFETFQVTFAYSYWETINGISRQRS